MRVPRSGVRYTAELEAELARIANLIAPDAWEAMDGDQQAAAIAVYRAQQQIEAVIAHERSKKT